MKTKILLLCLCLWVLNTKAQNNFIYGIKPNPGLTLERINISTGEMTPIMSVPYKVGFTESCATFDQQKHTYICVVNPNTSTPDRTFAIKCDTFAVDSSLPSVSYARTGFQYSELKKRLYCIVYDNTVKRNRIEYYNYSTKTTSRLDTIANMTSYVPGTGLLDKIKNIYYIEGFPGTNNRTLFAFNMTTAVTSQVTISNKLRPGTLILNPKDGKMYGLFGSAANSNKTVLGRLDPATGLHTEINLITGLKQYTSASIAIDPEYGRYFFTGSDTISDSIRLYTLDISTGNTLSKPSIGKIAPNTAGIFELEYQLVGQPSGIDNPVESENNLNIYPNPFNNRIHIEYASSNDGRTMITLFDLTGKQIMNKSFNATEGINNFEIETQSLKPGSYLLKISNDKEMVSRQIVKME